MGHMAHAQFLLAPTVVTGRLTLAHPLLLDRIVFRHTFHQKFSPNHSPVHILLNNIQMYNNMTMIEVHTLYMTIIEFIHLGSARNIYEQYTPCLLTHQPNGIGQHYQSCGYYLGDTCLWAR
jgi:hypothetical protein